MSVQNELVFEVVKDVVEKMLFAECVLSDDAPTVIPVEGFRSRIEYSGELSGVISMIAPREICSEWASFMAGDDSEELSMDVLKELTNVISGNIINRSVSDNGRVKLSPPSAEKITELSVCNSLSSADKIGLKIDGNLVLLAMLSNS